MASAAFPSWIRHSAMVISVKPRSRRSPVLRDSATLAVASTLARATSPDKARVKAERNRAQASSQGVTHAPGQRQGEVAGLGRPGRISAQRTNRAEVDQGVDLALLPAAPLGTLDAADEQVPGLVLLSAETEDQAQPVQRHGAGALRPAISGQRVLQPGGALGEKAADATPLIQPRRQPQAGVGPGRVPCAPAAGRPQVPGLLVQPGRTDCLAGTAEHRFRPLGLLLLRGRRHRGRLTPPSTSTASATVTAPTRRAPPST